MELQRGSLRPRPQRQIVQRPALGDPVRHQRRDRQRRRDGRAFEVLALARCVLGHVGHRDVEARQARQPAQYEEGQEQVVDGRAEPDGEG